jgi:RNA polymerase sigma-70 factor (ECF subfamily)
MVMPTVPPMVETSERMLQEKRRDVLANLASRRGEFVDFLRRRVRAGMDPEDLFQQAMLLATRKIDRLRDPNLAVPWFYRILRRLLADQHARRVIQQKKLPELQAAAELAPVEEAASCACSLHVMATLPAQYCEVLQRVYIGEEDLAAVAASLGMTTGTVAVRLHRARKALRRELLARCGTTSVGSCLDCTCEGGVRPKSSPDARV